MAKANKKQLSLDELLEQALVKEEDRPYEVPENWVWIRLGSVCANVQYGYTAKASVDKIGPKLLRITDIQNGIVNWGDVPYCSITSSDYDKFNIKVNDIVVARTGATTGKSYIIYENIESVFASYLIRIRLEKGFNSKFLYEFMQSGGYWNQVMELSQGIAQPGVNATKLQSMLFPLPPIAEQQRIVDIIDQLFEKLDTAKELVQNALDSFENRKAAILHKAFTGGLTVKWREENGVSLEKWANNEIKDLVTELNQGWSPKCEAFPSKSNEEWGVIKTTSIQHMEFIEEENKKLPNHLEPRKKHELKAGDILITRAGPRIRVGVCCLIKAVRPKLLLCDKAYRFRANESMVLPEYITYALNSTEILDEINKMKTGISESGVNLTQNGFLAIKLKVPSLREQQEIVRILDNLLDNEQRAKELCDVIEKIDLMKKAILAKAFRGELGTNDPEEESAVQLLKEVLKEKI